MSCVLIVRHINTLLLLLFLLCSHGVHKSGGDFLSDAKADLAQTANVVETDGRNFGDMLCRRQFGVEKNAKVA